MIKDVFWKTVDIARPEHLWTKNNYVWILKTNLCNESKKK